jgi:hypothetical protein
MIPGSDHASIKWFTDKGKRRAPLFRITIHNSYYEWSCLFNFSVIQEHNFLLRNKFDYKDVKYCKLKITNTKESYEIAFI